MLLNSIIDLELEEEGIGEKDMTPQETQLLEAKLDNGSRKATLG